MQVGLNIVGPSRLSAEFDSVIHPVQLSYSLIYSIYNWDDEYVLGNVDDIWQVKRKNSIMFYPHDQIPAANILLTTLKISFNGSI